MEFEPNQTITDEARILAQTKKVTLNPVDPFLKPEDTPDPILVPETHANIDQDSESTGDASHLIKPSSGMLSPTVKKTHHPAIKFMVLISSLTLGVLAGVSYFFFLG
jgi:hypothetical protein